MVCFAWLTLLLSGVEVCSPKAKSLGLTIKGTHNVCSHISILLERLCSLSSSDSRRGLGFTGSHKCPSDSWGNEGVLSICCCSADSNKLWWKLTSHHCRARVPLLRLMLWLACCSYLHSTMPQLDEALTMLPFLPNHWNIDREVWRWDIFPGYGWCTACYKPRSLSLHLELSYMHSFMKEG